MASSTPQTPQLGATGDLRTTLQMQNQLGSGRRNTNAPAPPPMLGLQGMQAPQMNGMMGSPGGFQMNLPPMQTGGSVVPPMAFSDKRVKRISRIGEDEMNKILNNVYRKLVK